MVTTSFSSPYETRTPFSDENKDDSHLTFGGSSVSFKQGRQLLRQYVLTLARLTVVVTRALQIFERDRLRRHHY